MRRCLFFLVLVNITFLVRAKRLKITCPSYCTCEVYSNLRKATCVNRTIVVADLEIPFQAQILDISFNQISQLKENVFLNNNLVHLRSLNISHNRIADISIFAFEGLGYLKVLDLSYNALQQILPRWFEALTRLEYLFLKGNHFRDMSTLEKNAFSSPKLKVLDLSDSHIIHITSKIFNLPHLTQLDLSGNQLISLNQEVLKPLTGLKVFKVGGNFLTCDKDMKIMKNVVKLKNIQYYGDPCGKTQRKFEKMVLETTGKINNENNYWVIEDHHDVTLEKNPVSQIPCQKAQEVKNIIELSELPQILVISTALVFGILIGLICGCSIKSCSMRYELGHYQAAVRLKKIKFLENETNLTLNESPLGYSTPILVRK